MAFQFVLVVLLGIGVPGCRSATDTAAALPPGSEHDLRCGEQGFLRTELYGALEARVQWTAAELECEGMPRPKGDGARLRFAGKLDDGRAIAFIVALPDLRVGDTGTEYRSNVTVIEEGNGRFFSTAELEICWTDISQLDNLGEAEVATRFAVSGTLYCLAPLTEINGDSDVTIRDLEFRGLLDWSAS